MLKILLFSLSTITFFMLGIVAEPAYPATFEFHHTWATICRPVDGAPFYVEANDSPGGSINIYNANGQVWPNLITDAQNMPTEGAFGITATGMGYRGQRTITMIFARTYSS